MPKLKPCPFCGSHAQMVETKRPRSFHTCCTNAKCILYPGAKWFKKEDEAIAAWNRRATEVLSTNEAANRIGITTIASASYWLDVIRHLEELGLKICEVKNME